MPTQSRGHGTQLLRHEPQILCYPLRRHHTYSNTILLAPLIGTSNSLFPPVARIRGAAPSILIFQPSTWYHPPPVASILFPTAARNVSPSAGVPVTVSVRAKPGSLPGVGLKKSSTFVSPME